MRGTALALRRAEQDKNGSVQAGAEQTQHDLIPERRSTQRILATVLVYGYGTTNEPFHQRTVALSTSGCSGIILLTAAVNPGEMLILTNEVNLKEEKCLVREISADSCGTRIVFEFVQPAPNFWD
jgi:hypothetical protein